jgi:hypothetical protein
MNKMSKAMETKINELFEATKDLQSFEEMELYCQQFNEWIATQNKSVGTLGKDFSKYGLYKQFNTLSLKQGKNAIAIPKHDAEGKVTGNTLKHYVVTRVGLTPEQWTERNQTTRVLDRLDNGAEIEPKSYLETTGELLESTDSHELAVGLIAATGRRPHEILARAKFEAILDKPYHVMFSGQGKKRGKTPKFEIATLYPADYIIKALARLRKEASTKALLTEVAREFDSITRQNVTIDNRRGKSLRRVIAARFGDKAESQTPILPIRHNDTQDNCKALRAAYAVLATERDCKGGYGAKILHAASILGHFVRENANDKALNAIATTAGYSDYFCDSEVPFPHAPAPSPKQAKQALHAYQADLEQLKQLQASWGFNNQAETLHKLIERQNQSLELGKQIQAKDDQVKVLKAELRELKESIKNQEKPMTEPTPAPAIETTENLDERIARILEEKLGHLMQASTKSPEKAPTKAPEKPVEKPVEKTAADFSDLKNSELWASKKPGATDEKIKRSFMAVTAWNDYQAVSSDERLAITNSILRDLSNCNGQAIKSWMESHADEIISHNSKYGLGNSKDAAKIETYANKRLGAEKISELTKKIKATIEG